MRLLIVDDEELTRTGVISSIDWKALGIHEIFQADDGLNGLEIARIHKPQIILTDVRMPRMDGITMLEKLESTLPDIIPIFMSGYSDKEYLKAAIKLKAVNYIEKPLNPAEIREAILEAKELYAQKVRSTRGETIHTKETASRLALQFTMPYTSSKDTIAELVRELSLTFSSATYFICYIVRLEQTPELTDFSHAAAYQEFQKYLQTQHMNCIYAEKRGHAGIYFVYGSTEPSRTLQNSMGEFLHTYYDSVGRHFVIKGDVVKGVAKVYQSYASAVILLQNSFFFPANTYLTNKIFQEQTDERSPLPSIPEKEYEELLNNKDQTSCDVFLQKLQDYFQKNCTLMQNQVKDIYYKLFLTLANVRAHLIISPRVPADETISDTLENCFTFDDLHQILRERTAAFFNDVQESSQESPTVLLIKDYINKNFMNETLSVKDISAHVFLSASYVCTCFKNETGQTLNQYLTEYRMEKAKQLLSDPRYKISDISSKVGYSDGNYFGKSFKKYSGLSPSEYREKTIR